MAVAATPMRPPRIQTGGRSAKAVGRTGTCRGAVCVARHLHWGCKPRPAADDSQRCGACERTDAAAQLCADTARVLVKTAPGRRTLVRIHRSARAQPATAHQGTHAGLDLTKTATGLMLVPEAPKMLNRLGRVVSGGKRGCTRAVLESMGVVCENADGGGWQGADRPQEHEHERVLRRAKACECTGQERERGIGKCNQCSGWRLLPSDRHEEEQCHELRCQECRGIAMCDEGGAPCGTEGTGAERTGPVLAMWDKARATARAGAAAAGGTLKCRGCSAVKHRRCHRSADKGRVAHV